MLPGCLLFVLQATDAMARPVSSWLAGVGSCLDAALLLVNGVLGRLPSGPAVDVGVLAYRGDGAPILESLLPETSVAAPFVSSNRLVKAGPKVCVTVSASGTASPAAAIAACAEVLRNWLALHPRAAPPLVVHLTDGHGHDELGRIFYSLKALSTAYGNVALMSCILTSSGQGIPPPCALGELGDESARSHWWWSNKTTNGKRLLSVNELPAVVVIWALDQLIRGDRRTILESADREDAGPRFESRLLWAPKAGNTDDEWEDGAAVDPECGRVAVTDGAGSGIFSRRWADIVARAAVNEPPPIPGSALAEWLQGCRERWLKELNLPELRYTQRRKVETVGTGATLLTLKVRPDREGGFRWEATSVGDSCLFWIRGGQLRATFPILRADDFGPGSVLLQTRPGSPVVVPLLARGLGKMGDFFLLVTDALAQLLLTHHERHRSVEWGRFWDMEEGDWRTWLDGLRQREEIVNDDCTLLAVRPV